MGQRLSKIYTRTGDQGSTGLGDGSRVPKDHIRVEAYGAVDELNSVIGMVLAETADDDVSACLNDVQHDLFDIGGELSVPGLRLLRPARARMLEKTLDRLNADLPSLREFILPRGDRAAVTCHLARAVCRRAERRVVSLGHEEDVNPDVLVYLNRLSDLLFVFARVLARRGGSNEPAWERDRSE